MTADRATKRKPKRVRAGRLGDAVWQAYPSYFTNQKRFHTAVGVKVRIILSASGSASMAAAAVPGAVPGALPSRSSAALIRSRIRTGLIDVTVCAVRRKSSPKSPTEKVTG
jgi:hypothetical protein